MNTLRRLLLRFRPWWVWLLRLCVGATFVFSGFAKAVDPWGFVYKIEEYLANWGVDWAPREIIFAAAVFIAMYEFAAGLMLAIGAFRRVSVYACAALMLVMLPLTAYIWMADPVADCGCFGDALIISNSATFLKNVALSLLIICLIPSNQKVAGLVAPLYQWLPMTAAALFCLAVSIIGYMVQPVTDFRPYKTGLALLPPAEGDDAEVWLEYKKDGETRTFSADALPDSTWTFVGRKEADVAFDRRQLAVYDSDYFDITDEVVADSGMQVILAVSNPEYHSRARANLSNRINAYARSLGGSMVALLPLSDEALDRWRALANPEYPTYTADQTIIKEMARGDAAFIFLTDGKVRWKRNAYSLAADFPESAASPADTPANNALTRVTAIDDGRLTLRLTLALAAAILLAALLSLPLRRK